MTLPLLMEDFLGALKAFDQAGSLGRSSENTHVAVPALCALGALRVARGELHQADQTYDDALRLAVERGGRRSALLARVYSGLSGLRYEWNDLQAAKHYATDGIDLGEMWGNADTLARMPLALARVLLAEGDLAGAQAALQRSERLAREHTLAPGLPSDLRASRIRLWLAQGNLAAASQWAKESGPRTARVTYVSESEHLALVRVLLAEERRNRGGDSLPRATDLLTRAQQSAEAGGRTGSLIEVLTLQALALEAGGQIDRAMALLAHALALGEAEGYLRTYLDDGKQLLPLLRRVAALGGAPDHAKTVLAALRVPGQAGRRTVEVPTGSSSRPLPLVEPLGERELEVLRLIATGKSNDEIARHLVVAVSTVKSHANHTFGKLGAQSRTQAVACARELGLL